MASKSLGSATVRAVRRALIPASSRAALILTPSAVGRIKQLLKDKDNGKMHQQSIIGLRIGVRQRGCNGLSYTMDFASKKNTMDEEVQQDGIRVFIDKKAQLSLLGTEMDWVETRLSAEFVFNNPNVKGICGCGESFTI